MKQALILGILCAAYTPIAYPQVGKAVFDRECATCHDGSTRAPAPENLRQRSPKSILAALSPGGAMQRQGARLSGDERKSLSCF